MRALRLPDWKTEPELVEVPEPQPGPGQVVIKVGAAALCGSDLHLMQDFSAGSMPWDPPFTLGHENAGWVHRLGPGVDGWAIGQAVAVCGPWGCARCARCRAGEDAHCLDQEGAPLATGGGLGRDGGIADYLLVPDARQLVALPNGVGPTVAATLVHAGLTSYHAVLRSREKLRPGATAVLIGAGGLGHLGVQFIAAVTGAEVVAVDNRTQALECALACGADFTVAADDDAAGHIWTLTRGRGADVVIDYVGTDETLVLATCVVRDHGDVTIVGTGGGVLPVSFDGLPSEVSVQTSRWGSRSELVEVLALAACGRIQPITTTYRLEEAGHAYAALRDGRITGRAVVRPLTEADRPSDRGRSALPPGSPPGRSSVL
jgi:propanol-preferring alcohol dehydrogenase